MTKLHLLEIDAGYYWRRWSTTATTELYTHAVSAGNLVAGVDVDGKGYTYVGSLAAVQTTNLSWWQDLTNNLLYVNVAGSPHDGLSRQRLGSETIISSLAALDANTILAGTQTGGEIYKSTDGGDTWTLKKNTTESGMLVLAKISSTSAVAGSYSGGKIWRTTDSGDTWTDKGQLGTETRVNVIAYLGNNGGADTLLAGTGPAGKIYKSTDGGNTWSDSGWVGAVEIFSLASMGSGTAVAGGSNGKVYKTTDWGATVDNGTTIDASKAILAPVSLGSGVLVAGLNAGGGIWRSTDSGATWTKVYAVGAGRIIECLAVSGTTVYAGLGNKAGLLWSTDSGATWSKVGERDETAVYSMVLPSSSRVIIGTGLSGRVYILVRDINKKTVKVKQTWHFSREGAVVNKENQIGTRAHFYDGRLSGIPTLTQSASPDISGGGASISHGGLTLRNNDGALDGSFAGAILDGAAVRLYEGTLGGTMPGQFTLRQEAFARESQADRTKIEISLASQVQQLEVPVGTESMGSWVESFSPQMVGQPYPVVFGTFVSVPAYFVGTPAAGTRQWAICAHKLGTVQTVREVNGIAIAKTGGASDWEGGFFQTTDYTAGSTLYADGVGYTVSGTSPSKPGEILRYLVGSFTAFPAGKIDTTSLSQLDTDRNIALSAWLGEGEKAAEAIENVCRSALAEWSVGRDGTFRARARNPRPANLLTNGDWERGSGGTAGGSILEDYDDGGVVLLSQSKMLLYSYNLLKDTFAGASMYRGTTLYTTGNSQFISLRGSNITAGSIAIYTKFSGGSTGYTAYEAILSANGTATLNQVIAGVRTLMGTAEVTIANFGTFRLRSEDPGQGTHRMEFNGAIVFTGTDTAIGGTYSAFGISQDFVGTLYEIMDISSGGTAKSNIQDGTFTAWDSINGGYHRGTGMANPYAGDFGGKISKGTGTIDGIQQRLIGGTSGQDYLLTMVVALQSGQGTFRASYVDAGGTEILSGTYNLGTGTYTRILHHFRPGSTGLGTVVLYPSYGGTLAGTVYVDNIEMFKVVPVEFWQIQGPRWQHLPALCHRVRVRHAKPTSGNRLKTPAAPFETDSDANNWVTSGTEPDNLHRLWPSSEEFKVEGWAYGSNDAGSIGDAVLAYYGKPRLRWEADFMDWERGTIALGDVLYVKDSRFPGLPSGDQILQVVEIEDIQGDGPPRVHVVGEIPYELTDDLMDA